MTEVILKKREARAGEVGLFPVDAEGDELVAKIKTGREVGCDVIQRRNPKHHRLFFAIIKFLQYHSPMWENVPIDTIKLAVKVATNLGTSMFDRESGKHLFVPHSISFAAMDQTRFDQFFDDACKVIAHRWMPPGTTAESVRDELLKMIEDPRYQGSRVA